MKYNEKGKNSKFIWNNNTWTQMDMQLSWHFVCGTYELRTCGLSDEKLILSHAFIYVCIYAVFTYRY